MQAMLVELEDIDRTSAKAALVPLCNLADFGKIHEAVEFISSNVVEVVLIKDYPIGHANAVEILSRLRKKAKYRFTAIAIMEYDSDVQKKYLLQTGFEGVLAKPVNPVVLTRLLNALK
jgi:CheY-like chemotaxis protein